MTDHAPAARKPKVRQRLELVAGVWDTDGYARSMLPSGWELRVRGAIPGERLEIEVHHVSGGGKVAWGRLTEVREPAEARRRPPCPIHGRCGACGIQQATDRAQLELKAASGLAELPTELASVVAPVSQWVRSPRTLAYRHKAVFMPTVRDRELILGGFRRGTHDVISLERCGVLAPALVEARDVLVSALGPAVVRKDVALRSVVMRASRAGEVLVTLVIRGGSEKVLRTLSKRLVGSGGPIAGIHLQVHDAPGDAVTGRGPVTRLAGRSSLDETIAGLPFRLSPLGFFQVNPSVLEAMVVWLAPRVEGRARLLDLYCGGGVLGMSLKADGGALLGVDTSKESIRAAALDAERHGIEAEFEVGPAGEVLPARGWDETWDVAIVDPPRQGIRGSDLQALIAAQPRRIVYVGCHAGSLGRDCRHLLEAGWTPSELVPVDMLPQTPHTEWIAILDR